MYSTVVYHRWNYCIFSFRIIDQISKIGVVLYGRPIETTLFSRYEEVFASKIEVNSELDPWVNTVAVYGDTTNMYLTLPYGTGINTMLDRAPNEKAKYAIVPSDSSSDWDDILLNQMQNHDHTIIFQDEVITILENAEYG